jgi:hypothetical protein
VAGGSFTRRWGACGLALVAAALAGASGCGSSGGGTIPLQRSGASSGGGLGGGNPLGPAIQRVVALRPLKGLAYKPSPSNYDGTGAGFYYDSDFVNDDFRQLWGPTGRDDIGNLAAAGVNFLHIYDWNQPGSGRSHTGFLNYCQQKRVSVAVPISVYYVLQVQQNNPATNGWFNNMVAEVYPGGTRHPAVVMWEIGNEFDQGGQGQTADGIAKTARAIVAAEDRAGIPTSERIAITSPVTFGIRGATGVEGADAVLWLQQAFAANGIADVFAGRFIASVNPFNPGSDLGPWASSRFPQATNNIPFCLFEMGKAIGPDVLDTVKTEDEQGAFYTAQLAAVLPLAKGSGPFLGQCVFSTVNETWKSGREATYGIYKISAPGGIGMGTTTNGQTYPIDRLSEKPTFTSMRSAYTAP